MTADEHVFNTKKAVEVAIKELTEVVINRTSGKFTTDPLYREKMKDNLFNLISVRENLN